MSVQAKDAEDQFKAAQTEQRAKLEQAVSKARESAEQRSQHMRSQADQTKVEVSAWWGDLQHQWDQQAQQVRSHLEAKREEHDAKRAAIQADVAEADAETAISIAIAAIEEAEYAALDALLARDKANELAVS
ncbi:MAG: hypothetical protein ACXVG8_10735 [Oryzihumus sp.]